MARVRIDTLLAERGLYPSRSRAAAGVLAGEVVVGEGRRRAEKPGQLVDPEDPVSLRRQGPAYVSRGGIKLQNALEALGLDPAGRDCLDVGSSTGGFTDCLLQRGAARVACVDVGYGELAWELRNDPRVTVLERTNARNLEPGDLPFVPDLAVCDVSFIAVARVVPAIARCLADGGELLALVKPQFEVGRSRVGKGGVVRDPEARRDALRSAAAAAGEAGLAVLGLASSGLPGPKGNRETFVLARRAGGGRVDVEAAIREVEP